MCLLMALAILFTAIPSAKAETVQPFSESDEYGYSFLNQLEKQVYMDIEAGIKDGRDLIEIDYDHALTANQLKHIVEMFTADHPECFWFTGDYSYSFYDGIVMGIYPKYVMDGKVVSKKEIAEANTRFQVATAQIMAEMLLESADSDYARSVWLHDKVAELVSYEYGPNHQTAYGALIDGKAVCAGYTRLYQYLLECAGIDAWTVKGTSINPGTGSPENHAWTLVWLDGKCVYTDVTWDDQGDDLFHVYFARSLEAFNDNHTLRSDYYENKVPQCSCMGQGYFDIYAPDSKITGEVTAERIFSCLTSTGEGEWTAVLFDSSVTTVENWLKDASNLNALIQLLGPGQYRLGMVELGDGALGREIHLKIFNSSMPSGVTVSGTVTSYLEATDVLTIQLIKSGEQNPSYQTEVTGKSAEFSIANVASGQYTVKLSKKNHVTRTYTLTVGSENVSMDGQICPIGDVTGDGKVNMKDWGTLYDHINEVSVLKDYSFACAEVTGEGKLNMKDWNRLYGHISETNPLW